MVCLCKAEPLFPALVIVGATPTPLFPGYETKPIFWAMVVVRTMGTAAWCLVGNSNSLPESFTQKGEWVIIDVPTGSYFLAGTLFAAADVAGQVVLEVSAMYPVGVT